MGFIPTSSSNSKSSKKRLFDGVDAATVDKAKAGVRSLNSKNQSSVAPSQGQKRNRRTSRKDFTIVRGALREGALYDPSESMSKSFGEDELKTKSKRRRIAGINRPSDLQANSSQRKQAIVSHETTAEKESPQQNKRARVQDDVKAARKKAKEEKKRARTKAKANKMFNASYDDSKSSSAAGAAETSAAPRAALYKGEMGSSQKKSARLQDQASPASSHKSKRGFSIGKLSPRVMRVVACILVAAFCVVSLYGPAQQYYQQMRETDRLMAEYEAVAARSNDLQEQIDVLGTDAGIEDKAHEDLGYIKDGEETAKVRGIKFEEVRDFAPNVVPNSIPAPETWYSPVLDIIFGYSN